MVSGTAEAAHDIEAAVELLGLVVGEAHVREDQAAARQQDRARREGQQATRGDAASEVAVGVLRARIPDEEGGGVVRELEERGHHEEGGQLLGRHDDEQLGARAQRTLVETRLHGGREERCV